MSLINDALKRARAAQQHAPEPEAAQPQLRPVEPEKHTRHNVGFFILAALVLIALGGLVLVWQIAYKRSPDIQEVSAKSPPANQPVVEASPTSASPSASTLPAKASSAPMETVQQPANSVATPTVATTNSTPVPEAAPAPPPPPKLQGIVFNPKRPSALIDGRTFFLGDRFGKFRVIAITPQSVTLAGAGVTNVWSFSE